MQFSEIGEIREPLAAVVAQGMRAVAAADATDHPAEVALIGQLEEALSGEIDPDAVTIHDASEQALLLRFLAVVALADQGLSDAEVTAMHEVTARHGIASTAVEAALETTAREMLATFRGASVYREQAEAIGRSLGLSPAAIAEVLG